MKLVSNRLSILCVVLGLASFLNFSAQAQIAVDGTRDASYGTPLSVQSVTSTWGSGNTLASISAKQEAGSLKVFLAGRPDGNALFLFIDSKSGGANVLVNNLISSGGEEWAINNFGTSATAGMTFETGFAPDFAIRIHGGGWTALYPLAPGSSRTYLGQSTVGTVSGGPVTALRTVYNNVTGNFADHNTGVEIDLSLAGLGVPTGPGQTIKFMAILINQGSDFAPNQTLGSLPAGSGDLGAGFKTTDFNTVSGTQTISMTVDNTDADGDGIPDATDPDDDNDGLTDVVETNTGTFVDANNTGSNPLVADTDGDGMNDSAEVAASRDPNKFNYAQITVAGGFQGWSPAPTPTSAPANVMIAVPAGSLNYELLWRFTNAVATEGKFTAGSWSVNWGATTNAGVAGLGADPNIPFNVTASGVWKFTFNTDTRAYSFARQAAPGTYADWAAQYGLAAGSGAGDADSDFLTNTQEFSANSDPTNSDTDGDGLFDDEEVTGDYSEVTPAVPVELAGKVLSPITNDTDGDGLRDLWEITNGLDATDNGSLTPYVNATGLTVTANPNGANGDPDGDGLTNLAEQAAGSNPRAAGTGFASVQTKVTVPGSFNGYNAGGNAANTMQLVGNFTWNLIVYFPSAPVSPVYKFAAGSWATNWGDANPPDGTANPNGGDISGASVFTAPGYYMITFNDLTLAYSASALAAADLDSDGLPDAWEAYYGSFLSPKTTDLVPTTAYVVGGQTAAQAYAAGANPVADVVAPTIALAVGVDKVTWVANGGTLNLANSDVTATDAISTPVVTFTPATVDTSVDGLTTVTYTATDADGNAASVSRVIAVGSVAPGYRNLRFPAAMTINTLSSDFAYGEIYVDGATAGTGGATGIKAWIGVNTNNTDPSTWDASVWSAANYLGEEGNNDNYQGQISGTNRTPGTYYYATRFQLGTNNTNYHFGGIGTDGVGGTWGATRDVNVVTGGVTNVVTYTNGSGLLTVQAARTLTFAVNMNVQTNKSLFTPTNQGVEVRGSFTSPTWAGGLATLTDADNDGIYTGSFTVAGDLGTAIQYKFYRTGATGGGFEGLANDRSYTLGANGVNATIDTAFFNNDDGIGPEITRNGLATINLTVGDSYTDAGATAADAIDGSVTVTPSGTVDTSVAGTYTITYNATDAAGNAATSVTRTVIVAAASGSTFAGWSSNALVTSELVGKYGIGGATSSSAASERPEPGLDSNTLSLSAIVRTNDAKLKVEGEASGSLTNWSTNGVTMTASPNTNGVPGGHQRQVFSVDRTNSPTKQFLRLKATLAP